MPISDFMRSFLQNVQYLGTGVGWTPEQQQFLAQQKQRQSELAQGQRNWQQEFANKQASQQAAQEESQGRLFAELLKNPDFQMAQPGGRTTPEDTLTGGQTPSFGAGGGVQGDGQQRPTSQTILPTLDQLMGAQGQQQTGGQLVNAPGGVPPGAPADRMPTANASSAGGAAVQVARTPQRVPIPGLGKFSDLLQYNPQPTSTSEKTLPYTFKGDEPGFAQFKGQTHQLPPSIISGFGKAEKTPADKEELDQQKTAAQDVAKLYPESYKDPSKLTKVNDLLPEHQDQGWAKKAAIKDPIGEAQKQAKIAELNQATEVAKQHLTEWTKTHGQPAIDGLVETMAQNPDVYNNIKMDADVAGNVARAWKEKYGISVPKKLTQGISVQEDASQTVQGYLDEMKQIRQELGPDKFGPMVGRLENAEGKWGAPVFQKDSKESILESRFRFLQESLSAQEARLLGGGRANYQLYNSIKSITPNLRMSPNVLEGYFQGLKNRIDITKDAAVKARFGGGVRRAPDGTIWRKDGNQFVQVPITVN